MDRDNQILVGAKSDDFPGNGVAARQANLWMMGCRTHGYLRLTDMTPPTSTRFLTIKQIVSEYPISRATCYRLMAAGRFAPAIRVTANKPLWDRTTFEAWLISLTEQPTTPTKLAIATPSSASPGKRRRGRPRKGEEQRPSARS